MWDKLRGRSLDGVLVHDDPPGKKLHMFISVEPTIRSILFLSISNFTKIRKHTFAFDVGK